jgi:hypothetical protein
MRRCEGTSARAMRSEAIEVKERDAPGLCDHY